MSPDGDAQWLDGHPNLSDPIPVHAAHGVLLTGTSSLGQVSTALMWMPGVRGAGYARGRRSAPILYFVLNFLMNVKQLLENKFYFQKLEYS